MKRRNDTFGLSFRKVSFCCWGGGRGEGKLGGGGGQRWNGSTKEKTKRINQDRNTKGNVTKVECVPIQVE